MEPDGVVKATEVAEFTVTFVAALPSTVTLVAPVKFVPVIVTVVPPAVTPEMTSREVIVGVEVANAVGLETAVIAERVETAKIRVSG